MSQSQTVFGIVCDEASVARVERVEHGIDGPRLRSSAWSTRASDVRTVQSPRIPIDTAHDGRELGEVVALIRRGPNLYAVGHVNEDVRPAVRVRVADDTVSVPTPLYWSAMRDSNMADEDILLREVALTAFPARVGAKPVTFLPGLLDHRGAATRWRDKVTPFELELLTAACMAHLERRAHGGPVVLQGDVKNRNALAMRGGAYLYLDGDELVMPAERRRPPGAMRHGRIVRGSVLRVS